LSTPNKPPPPPQQPDSTPPTSKRKYIWLGVGIFVLLVIVGQCGKHNDNNSSSSSSSSPSSPSSSTSAAAAPPAEPTSTTPPGPTPPSVKEFSINEQPGPDGTDLVSATYKIGENLTEGLTKDTARIETSQILQYAVAKYPNLTEVDVHARADMTDEYGNSKEEEVATLTYSRATLNRINWQNFNTNNMWNIPIADSADVAPAFLY
jgi:hypothetical protein